jgi:hypothetical protein
MRSDSQNGGASNNTRATVRQQSASSNGAVGGGVFCAVRAERIWEGILDKPSQSAECSESEYEVGVS